MGEMSRMADEVIRARSLEAEGRLDDALKLCLKGIRKRPRDLSAREFAVELCKKLENVVELSHQLVELADLLWNEKRHDAALEKLDELLVLCAENRPQGEQDLLRLLQPQIHLQKGQIHRDCQRLQMAEKCFRDSMALNSDRWQTYLELGRTLTGMARYEEAAQVLQDGMRLNPLESAPILEALGDVFQRLGRDSRSWYEGAVAHYRRQDKNEDVMRLSAWLMNLHGDDYLKELLDDVL